MNPVALQMLRAMPWLEVRRARQPERGRYFHASGTALVRHGLRGAEYYCTLVHELIHAERGDQLLNDDVLDARQELAVEKETARRLIDIHRLADIASAYPDDPHRVAEELDVDYDTLAIRVRWLHPAERHYLRRRLAACEETA